MTPSSPMPAEPVAGSATMQIPFIDLKAQQARIRPALDRAIARVLEHGQYIMGPEVLELERRLQSFTGAAHAISCASGTDALMMAMMAKEVGPGQAVLCPAFTYTATPESLVLLGGTPVFVDVEHDSFNISVATLEGGLHAARKAGLRPVGIIGVDLFGQPADYAALNDFADAHGLWLLADAAQSFGAECAGRRVGTLAEMTVTSFFPAKPLGCYGDGGAIFTEDAELAAVLRSIRSHGRGVDKYDVIRHGINGRLDTIQAAVLIEKLSIFEDEIERRQVIAARYSDKLANVAVIPSVPPTRRSVWAQYTLRVDAAKRTTIQAMLKARGIPTEIYYPRPLHHQPAYRPFPIADGGLPISETLAQEVLSLPMHPYLDEATQDLIIGALAVALRT